MTNTPQDSVKTWHDIHVLTNRGWVYEREVSLGANPDEALKAASSEHKNAARLVRCDWDSASNFVHEVRIRSQMGGAKLTEDTLSGLRVDCDVCQTSWELYEDRSRDFARRLLSDFTDRRHLVIYELLHSAKFAELADREPMLIQNAIQRAAGAQSLRTEMSTSSRTRRLMTMREKLLQRVREITGRYIVPSPVETGGMKGLKEAWGQELRKGAYSDSSEEKNDSALWKMMIGISLVSGSPVEGANWLERIAYVAALGAAKLSPVYAREIDKYMSDLLAVPEALTSVLKAKSQSRRDHIMRTCVMHSGQTRIMLRHLDPKIARNIDSMMAQGIYKRSHDVLRRSIIVELGRRAHWLPESDLISDQLNEIAISEKFIKRIPYLYNDEEVMTLLSWNYNRFLSVESLANYAVETVSANDKIIEFAKIAQFADNEDNLGRVEAYATRILKEEILPTVKSAERDDLLQSVEVLMSVKQLLDEAQNGLTALPEMVDKILISLLRGRIVAIFKQDKVALISFMLKVSKNATGVALQTVVSVASEALTSDELSASINRRSQTLEQADVLLQTLKERVGALTQSAEAVQDQAHPVEAES